MTTCRSGGARAHIRTWKSKRSDTGSVSTELVLLAPALVLMVLLIVLAGRAGQTVEQVRHAADQGARAASLVSRPAMAAAARRAICNNFIFAKLQRGNCLVKEHAFMNKLHRL